MWPVEFGPEESRRSFQNFVGATQLSVLTTQPFDLRGLLAGDPRPVPAIDLRLTDPLAYRLSRRAQLGRHRTDRRPLRRIVLPRLRDQPNRACPLLRRMAVSTRLGPGVTGIRPA